MFRFFFFKSCQNVFQSNYIILHFHHQSSFFASLPELNIITIFNFSYSDSVQCYLIAALICIFLMASDVEHFFVCLFAWHISSWMKCLFMFLPKYRQKRRSEDLEHLSPPGSNETPHLIFDPLYPCLPPSFLPLVTQNNYLNICLFAMFVALNFIYHI